MDSGTKSEAAPVTEKAFEDYHLYSLPRAVTLHDRETKQVEFIRATGVHSEKLYVYDGLQIPWSQYRGYNMENIRNNENLGSESETKVAAVREFKNSAANHLGMPLPKGRVRFYKQDSEQQLEFTGENTIDETFEITLRNHKTEPAEIRVVEHLFRWTNWEITAKSDAFTKTNAQTIEFRVPVKPDEEKKLSYTVHYSW